MSTPEISQVLAQMLVLRESGSTLVVTTHDIEKLLPHAERVVVLAAGRTSAKLGRLNWAGSRTAERGWTGSRCVGRTGR